MIQAKEVVETENGNIFKIEKKYEKCTICGLYGIKKGEEKEIVSNTIVNNDICVNICCNCIKYLEEGGKAKKRKFFPESVEDYID